MKSFALCLVLAITCGVALSYNTTDPYACHDARTNITKAEKAIEAEKDRLYPNQREIANLEAVIYANRRVANLTCAPEVNCFDGKNGLVKVRKAIEKEKDSLYPNREVLQKLNQEVASYQEQIISHCNGTDVCSYAKEEIQRDHKLIGKEKDRLYPDRSVLSALEADIVNFKRVMILRCPANETCVAAKEELNMTRKAIEKEKDRLYPDRNVLAKLEAEAANSSELIINTCSTSETCAFIEYEINFAQRAISKEKDRLYPNREVVAKLEGEVQRLHQLHTYRCNNGFMRLAEVAARGGRFLAKFLRH